MAVSSGKTKYIQATDDNIRSIVRAEIKQDAHADLSLIDVSAVTNMSYLFLNSPFDGDISTWEVGNVADMTGMFMNSKFSGDISHWDVSKVKKHDCCFDGSPLEKQPNKQPKFNP